MTVYSGQVRLLSDAATNMPLAVKSGPSAEPETPWPRGNLVASAHRHKVVSDKGFWDGTDLWWLDQHNLIFAVPVKANMAVPAATLAQAAAPERLMIGCRVQAVRHGQGSGSPTELLETAVGGIIWPANPKLGLKPGCRR